MASVDLSEKQAWRVREKIKEFIKETVEKAGAKGVVVGLSGGIDSALAASLAAEAGLDVKALILPETGLTPPDDVEHAVGLAKKLGIEYKIIDIKEIVDATARQYGAVSIKESVGNIKARARMMLLYTCANEENRLVLGTGNKTELMVGYFTKYGDGGVDLLPLAGLYKTQVRKLAEKIGVSKDITGKNPSAGLCVGQTDEDDLGCKYETLDELLHLLYDVVTDLESAASKCGIDEEKVWEIRDRVAKNTHKTRPPNSCDLTDILG